MDKEYLEEVVELLSDAKGIKEKFGLESIDTALLILIKKDISDIRFRL